MHTFQAKGGTVFNFNSDMSGTVIVRARDEEAVMILGPDLMAFFLELERRRIIYATERAEDDAISEGERTQG